MSKIGFTKRLDLNGHWKMRWSDGQRGGSVQFLFDSDVNLKNAIDVTVPGEVHDELIKKGLLSDPNLERNILGARWVEETIWFYRKTFKLSKIKKDEKAWLVFKGLDLAAVIYLNGVEIGRHSNYFYPCRIEITDKLKIGENILVVQIESGLFHVMHRSAEGYGVSLDSQLAKRLWLRKPQCSFGWDWAPRLLNVGIHDSVYLEISRFVRIDDVVILAELSEDLKVGTITARVFVEGLENNVLNGKVIVEICDSKKKIETKVKIKQGSNCIETKVIIGNPKLWWPVNHGKQNMYTVHMKFFVNNRLVSINSRKVGFRRIRINQEKHPEKGNYFILEVNKKPIFAKGGNFVPADIIFTRIDKKVYNTLINRALEANFNFLRVWGGGLYEKDEFYEFCDEKGILVWQEFIFACAKYPTTDEKFLADIKNEVTYQIRRLVHHPSLVIWCGNNEMEQGTYDWNYADGVAYPDYALFHMVIPNILKQEDPTRYYQPSSPFSPNYEHPTKDDMGDQHPWSVGFLNTDFRDYRKMICRFPNEGGILGPTALPTVKACLSGKMENPGSFAWEIHENSITYWNKKYIPNMMLQQWLGLSIDEMNIEDYVYYSGILQGEGLSEYIKNFRRRMFSSASAIFWMFNDCWPAVRSWTIVDYYRRRTPSFYPVRRAFAPIIVVVVRENNKVRIYGINEGNTWEGKVRYGIFALEGVYPVNHITEVILKDNSSSVIAEFDASIWDKLGISTHVAFAILFDNNGNEISMDRLFIPFFKEMKWPRAKVIVRLKNGKAIFKSKVFIWRVCLDLNGEKQLPDNFFDIYPGIPTVLEWPIKLGKPRILRVGNL